jgi:hypothetical protein
LKYYLQFIVFIVISLLVRNSFSGDPSNARNMGMSYSGMVSSYGIDAYGINPANYYINKYSSSDTSSVKIKSKQSNKPFWSISLLSVGGGYGCDSNMNFYNKYLGYLSINRQTFANLFTDITSVLQFRDSILPNNRTDVNYDFELKWFSLNLTFPHFGALNFTISDKVGLNTDANSRDEYLPLNFNLHFYSSTLYDLTNVEIHQSEATAWWIRKYTLGFAKIFEFKKGLVKNISIGFSGGLVHGFGNVLTFNSDLYMNSYGIYNPASGDTHVDSIRGRQNFNTQAALTDFFKDYQDGAKSHFTFFPKPAGKGYTMDVGIAVQFGDKIKIAASVTDLGKIKWDYNTFTNYDHNNLKYNNMNINANDPTYNRFVNDLEGLDTRDTITPYWTDMPTKYRVGLMYQPSNKLMFEFDWVMGQNDLPGNSKRSIFSLGSEYIPVPYLPLRGGISIGGTEDFQFSLGAGLRFKNLSFDLAAGGINNLISDKRISLSFSSKVMF